MADVVEFFMASLRLLGRLDTSLKYQSTTVAHQRLVQKHTFALDEDGWSVESLDTSPFFPIIVVAYTHVQSRKSKVVVWSMKGNLEKVLVSTTRIKVVQFSKIKSNILYGCGANGKLLTWDLNSHSSLTLGESLKFANCHTCAIVGMVQDTGKCYTCDLDGTVCFWSLFVDTGGPMRDPLRLEDDHGELGVSCVVPGGLVGCSNGRVVRVNLETGEIREVMSHYRGLVCGLDSEGDYVVSSGLDKTVQFTNTVSLEKQVISVRDIVMDIKFQPQTTRFVTVDMAGSVKLWDLDESANCLESADTGAGLNKMTWINDTEFLCGGINGVHLFEIL